MASRARFCFGSQSRAVTAQGPSSAGVAVGGTATTLAALELKFERYSYAQVQGYFLPCSRLHSLTERMRVLPLAQRRQLPGLQPERADIILAGAAILSLALEILALPGLTVSAADLLLGSLHDLLAVYPLSQQRSRQ